MAGRGSAAESLDLWGEAWSLDPGGFHPRGQRAAAVHGRAAVSPRPEPVRPAYRPRERERENYPPERERGLRRSPARARGAGNQSSRTLERPAVAPRPRTFGFRFPGILPVCFFAFCALFLVALPLTLNVATMRLDWSLAQLEEQSDTLLAERSHLKTQVAALSSAPRIKEAADRMGMAFAPEVDYVILEHRSGPALLAQVPVPPGGAGN